MLLPFGVLHTPQPKCPKLAEASKPQRTTHTAQLSSECQAKGSPIACRTWSASAGTHVILAIYMYIYLRTPSYTTMLECSSSKCEKTQHGAGIVLYRLHKCHVGLSRVHGAVVETTCARGLRGRMGSQKLTQAQENSHLVEVGRASLTQLTGLASTLSG